MSVDRAQLKVQLRNLREWRKEYYNGTPLVPDAVYDDVEDQIRAALSELTDGEDLKKEIETFLAEVGAAVPAGTASAPAHWVKVKHKAPAGSLNKAQTADEFVDWMTTCRKMIGLPTTRFVPGTRVKTVAVPNPSTDWDPAAVVLRRFGVDGFVVKHSDSRGLCYEVEHADDKSTAWYEPRELEGPGVVRGVWSEKMDGISCFDGDTPVHLANGETVSIKELVEENLRPRVLSWDPVTGETTEQVVAAHDNGVRENWIRLTLDDGSTVLVTEEHLFFVPEEGWVQAKDLLGKDLLGKNLLTAKDS